MLGKLSVLKTAAGKKIKIIESVAPLWQSLVDKLEFDSSGSKLGLIKATHPNGNGVRPCSWCKLIELLEDCDLDDLASEVVHECSDSINNPYYQLCFGVGFCYELYTESLFTNLEEV